MEVIIVNSALLILLLLSSFYCRRSSLQQLKKNTVVPASCIFTFHDFCAKWWKRENQKKSNTADNAHHNKRRKDIIKRMYAHPFVCQLIVHAPNKDARKNGFTSASSAASSLNARGGMRREKRGQGVRVSASLPEYPQSTEDLYFILGVSVGASQEAVKRAYKRKAKRYHPDVNSSPESAEKFIQIKAAYETIQSTRGNLENDQTREWKEKWKQQLRNLRREREKKIAVATDRENRADKGVESLVGTMEMQAQISNQLRNLKARTNRKRTRQQTLQKSTFKEPFELSEEDLWNHEVQ